MYEFEVDEKLEKFTINDQNVIQMIADMEQEVDSVIGNFLHFLFHSHKSFCSKSHLMETDLQKTSM